MYKTAERDASEKMFGKFKSNDVIKSWQDSFFFVQLQLNQLVSEFSILVEWYNWSVNPNMAFCGSNDGILMMILNTEHCRMLNN